MKLPKYQIISGKKYETKFVSGTGGTFNTGECVLTIGDDKDNAAIECYAHEVIETILTERVHRYQYYADGVNEGIKFVFDHAEFVNIVKDIIVGLNGLFKPEYAIKMEDTYVAPSTKTRKKAKGKKEKKAKVKKSKAD